MAQNGGARHTRTAETSPPSSAATLGLGVGVGPSEMRERITLSQPRPDGVRNGNYYTETPLRPIRAPFKCEKSTKIEHSTPDAASTGHCANLAPVHRTRISPAPPLSLSLSRANPCVTFTNEKKRLATHKDSQSDDKHKHKHKHENLVPVPVPVGVRVGVGVGVGVGVRLESNATDSILCTDCGKCKCMACRRPRALPSRWICDSRYECSAEALLDTCTCMCCVKGVFYHCTKDYDMDDDVSCADRPCSCAPDRRCVRWSCMGALSLVMPCLLCYWPLKACMKGCETCYARYHSRGCECTTHKSSKLEHQTQSNKRLLDSHNSS